MAIVCGIDDAGRGPVIGPMVLAGALINGNDLQKLKELGVKDSKLLSPKKREELYNHIISLAKNYKIIVVSPEEIDQALESDTSNLNILESKKFAQIINVLKPEKTIVDCPSNNIVAYTSYLKTLLKVDTKLECHHKADFKFIEVGCASILAKVTRDREIEKIQKRIKIDFGSGYPSDPLTKEFLKKNWNKYPDIFRHSWATFKEVSEGKSSKKQMKIGDF